MVWTYQATISRQVDLLYPLRLRDIQNGVRRPYWILASTPLYLGQNPQDRNRGVEEKIFVVEMASSDVK